MQQLPKLSSKTLSLLKNRKNLLAFSAGVDSSALFFILKSHGIEFDIALVNYQTRTTSYEEESYALSLAKRFDKKAFIKRVKLKDKNFEHNARITRYDFFKEIIKKEGYNSLITAHQLNDRFEWFLMQLSKGAGVVELLGFDEIKEREDYTLFRPLANVTKEELEDFLKRNKIKYFIDKSNKDEKYKRNFIRKNFAEPFLKLYKNGIIKSFEYLNSDKSRLYQPKILYKEKELYILEKKDDDTENIREIDEILKANSILLSNASRRELLNQKESVVSHKMAVCITKDKIFIAPYIKTTMDKDFKEKCRTAKIPPKIRGYLYQEKIIL